MDTRNTFTWKDMVYTMVTSIMGKRLMGVRKLNKKNGPLCRINIEDRYICKGLEKRCHYFDLHIALLVVLFNLLFGKPGPCYQSPRTLFFFSKKKEPRD